MRSAQISLLCKVGLQDGGYGAKDTTGRRTCIGSFFEDIGDPVLVVLTDLLKGNTLNGHSSYAEDADNAGINKKAKNKQGAKGIYKMGDSRYFVQACWENFRLRSQLTESLSEALNWQINTMQLKQRSMQRIKASGDMKNLSGDAVLVLPEKKPDPLTNEELQQLLRREPNLYKVFACSDLSG